MFVYVSDIYHTRKREKTHDTIDDLVARAAVEIAFNYAAPVKIEDESGGVVVDNDDLKKKAWDYIECHDI